MSADPETLPAGRRVTRRGLIGLSGAALLVHAAGTRAQAAGAALACVSRPPQTEGPFFVDDALDRVDIRSDPRTGTARPGVPLRLAFRVSRTTAASCAPVADARIDVWHSDAEGRYSEVRGFGAAPDAGGGFLRGYQLTDATGAARFLTIYPGWYGGRAVHVHFKIRTRDAAGAVRDFTSQIYFDDRLSERVFAREPYASRGRRWLRNAEDGLYRDGGPHLLVGPEADGEGYAATFEIALPA